jgi:uncharacterized protein YndB with AHSA1/START domain
LSTTSQNKVLSKDVVINAPLSLVWHAWTISDRVSKWFASDAFVEPKEGGAFELYFEPGNTTGMCTKGCKIEKFVPQQEVNFQWKGPDQFDDLMNKGELTLVKVSFKEIDEITTEVQVNHTGWKSGEEWDQAYKWHEMAWSGVLSSLKSSLEKGEGELCCQPE